MASNQSIAQTPQDPAVSSAPFAIHVDSAKTTTTTTNSSFNPTEAKSMSAFEDAVPTWEVPLFDCCDSCSTGFQAFLFPCLAAGDAALSIGAPGGLVGLFMLPLYIGAVVFSVLYGRQHGFEVYTETHYSYGRPYTYSYIFEGFQPKYGLLAGALVCAFVYSLIVCKVRNMVRRFYRIPGSWVKDLLAALLVTCCVVAQVKRHTTLAEAKKKAEEEAATLPAYSEA